MRITELRRIVVLGVVLLGSALVAAPPPTPYLTLAELATDFSTGDAPSALDKFDSGMPDYMQLSNNIQALVDQTEMTCAIDVVSDDSNRDIHDMHLDWIMNLKSKGDDMTVERRREQVKVEMREIKGKWKITMMSPQSILDPIHISGPCVN